MICRFLEDFKKFMRFFGSWSFSRHIEFKETPFYCVGLRCEKKLFSNMIMLYTVLSKIWCRFRFTKRPWPETSHSKSVSLSVETMNVKIKLKTGVLVKIKLHVFWLLFILYIKKRLLGHFVLFYTVFCLLPVVIYIIYLILLSYQL